LKKRKFKKGAAKQQGKISKQKKGWRKRYLLGEKKMLIVQGTETAKRFRGKRGGIKTSRRRSLRENGKGGGRGPQGKGETSTEE